jgi:hypothetical protein
MFFTSRLLDLTAKRLASFVGAYSNLTGADRYAPIPLSVQFSGNSAMNLQAAD